MAGAGYTNALGMACPQGVNVAYDGVSHRRWRPGDAAADHRWRRDPDQISIVRSNSDLGVAPATDHDDHGQRGGRTWSWTATPAST